MLATAIPQPAAPPPTDTTRDVYVYTGRLTSKELKHRPVGAHDQLSVLRLPQFFLIGVFVTLGYIFGAAIARLFALPALWLGLAGALAAAIVFTMIAVQRISAKPPATLQLIWPSNDDPSRRLRLHASARQAYASVIEPPLSDDPFEPRIVPLRLAVPHPSSRWYAIWIVSIVLVSIAWTYVRVRYRAQLGVIVLGPWDYWAIMCLMLLPYMWTWPTYLRVSPGRLDIIRYRFLGIGKPTTHTYDLRRARVHVSLMSMSVHIEPPSDESWKAIFIQLNQWGPPNEHLARAILEAARWEGDLQPLPDDQLIG